MYFRNAYKHAARFHSLSSIHHSTTSTTTKRKVIFSGIQPTGVPHLGNYLGALRQWVQLQDEAAPDTRLLYSLVDLHAITVKQDPEQLRKLRRDMMATLIAVGLDPNRSILFHQSSVPAHSELMWILSCYASMGYLSRMTQWKSKLSLPENASPLDPSTKTKLKLGLFSYPVLQAADILVHQATHVPVGADQAQHLEFSREIAASFNHFHGDVLVPPDTIISPAKRVMSLTQPTLKMSKSHSNPTSRILLTDSRDTISSKIRSAVTDSTIGVTYDPVERPGVSNLVAIMVHLNEEPGVTCDDLANDMKDFSMKSLKEKVTDCIEKHLEPIRERYLEVINVNEGKVLADAAETGAQKASESATVTMNIVRNAIGL
ncbi:tryptophanyl-tRNA synthetase [Patellaria atrata CBS 101060]|uniref:Tryptophan--tRNA ligase, mitochondrial n=1 Tax=Patellaria atrata CBS 101060 TaxID=1346257 RepID=A0A9P4SH37_9PEZI|nr:tryptophanyl-tRNA synthetase [Patellaria atrata CBS 101060]